MDKIPAVIYVAALHNILKAMKGLCLCERFGFNLLKPDKSKCVKLLSEYSKLKYDPSICDWVDDETELKISDYILPHRS